MRLGRSSLSGRERERETHIIHVGSKAGEIIKRSIVGSVKVDAKNKYKNEIGGDNGILATMRYLRVFWRSALVMMLSLQRHRRSILGASRCDGRLNDADRPPQ
mgnify:CR=1 FL=1